VETKKKEKTKSDITKKIERTSKIYWDLTAACRENINDLVAAAQLLFDNGFYSKSFALSYTALEEMGKDLLVCDYINDIVSDSEFEAGFRDHSLKMAYQHSNCMLTQDGTVNKIGLPSIKATIIYDESKYKPWLKERNNSLYVDLDKATKTIKKPKEEITKEDSEAILQNILRAIKRTNELEFLTERIGSKAFYK